jgi:hypothetical protein
MPSTPSEGGGGGALPSVRRQAQMASATVRPQATPAAHTSPLIQCLIQFARKTATGICSIASASTRHVAHIVRD